jgi:hypothetical protein
LPQQHGQWPESANGKHGKIILTTPEIVERERKDNEIDIDDADVSLSGEVEKPDRQ